MNSDNEVKLPTFIGARGTCEETCWLLISQRPSSLLTVKGRYWLVLKGRICQSSSCAMFGVLCLSVCVDFRCALCIRSLFTFGRVLARSPGLCFSVQGFLHLCVVIQSLSHRVDNVLLQIQFKKKKSSYWRVPEWCIHWKPVTLLYVLPPSRGRD